MSLRIQNSRQLLKRTTVSGATPTVNTGSTQHTDGTWTVDEIYAGELYWNMQDKYLYLGWEDISGTTGVDLIYPGGSFFTGGSGNCITDFYVENINACTQFLSLVSQGNGFGGYIDAVYTTSTNSISEMILSETIPGVPNASLRVSDSGNTYFNNVDLLDTGVIIEANLVGGTSHLINMDSPGNAMNITTSDGTDTANIGLTLNPISNFTKIELLTVGGVEESSLTMTKFDSKLSSTFDSFNSASGSSLNVGGDKVYLQVNDETVFGATKDYVYHTTAALTVNNTDKIFYHLERIKTTGATPTTLYTIPFTPNNSVMTIKAIINGSENGGGDVYGAEYFGVFKNLGGTVTRISTLDKSEKTDFATATSDIIISGTDIIIQVTGEAATNINWGARFNYLITQTIL